MKHILKITVVLFVLASCRPQEQPVTFCLDKTNITIGAEGGMENVHINSAGNWYAEITPVDGIETPWISVSPMNGSGSADCQVSIDTTLLAKAVRKGNIRFYSDNGHVDLRINQTGYEDIIYVEQEEYDIPDYAPLNERYITLEVTANVKFRLDISQGRFLDGTDEGMATPDWIENPRFDFDLDRKARPRTARIEVKWQGNSRPFTREGGISIVPANPVEGEENPSATVILKQRPAPKIENNRQGDSLAIVSIARSIGFGMYSYEGERMDNWGIVTLWDGSPKSRKAAEAVHYANERNCKDAEGNTIPFDIENYIGRVRSVAFQMFYANETLPEEIEFLSTVEELSFKGNANVFTKSFIVGDHIGKLTQLKRLTLYSYGIVGLTDGFANLKNLEYLDLGDNNFNVYPDKVLNGKMLPKLKYLALNSNRRFVIRDLSSTSYAKEEWGGLSNLGVIPTGAYRSTLPVEIFTFPDLEYLTLSYNYILGCIPEDFAIQNELKRKGYESLGTWTEQDIAEYGDTLVSKKPETWNLLGKMKILPKCRYRFSLNHNVLSGKVPEWILYHPFLMLWFPEDFVFWQDSSVKDLDGKIPELTGVPKDPAYYYEIYPLWKPKEIE